MRASGSGAGQRCSEAAGPGAGSGGRGGGCGFRGESQGRLVGIYTAPESACDLAALAPRTGPTEQITFNLRSSGTSWRFSRFSLSLSISFFLFRP